MALVFILLTSIIILIGFIALRVIGHGNFPWVQFYLRGRDSGFSFGEVNLLRKAAIETRLENPTALFWSISQLDRTIRAVIIKARAEDKIEDENTIDFISKMYDFRKQVELNTPKYKIGLKSTRGISPQQKIRITLPGIGTYYSQIVENLRKYMAVSYPQGKKLPLGFSWKTKKLNIYFWRGDDAGYFFETRVLDDFLDRKYPILYIAHSDTLIRSQKRQSIRAEANCPVSIYNLMNIDNASEHIEHSTGLRGRMLDISEDGAAVLVGGRAKVGLPLKIQFTLTDSPLVMCGIVKGVTFDEKKNRSVLHIQATPPSPGTKNAILSYVYNIFEEREERKKRKRIT